MPADESRQDLLAQTSWHCAPTEPGRVAHPSELSDAPVPWLPAQVPGTAAAALRDADVSVQDRDLDADDWWFGTRFLSSGSGPWRLRLDGLATIADVWLNGAHVLHSENMFVSHAVEIAALEPDNELVIRFAALRPLFAKRRPRPQWKVARLRHQTQRWYRTTLLGRLIGWVATPAPVGPWRPITLTPVAPIEIEHQRITATCSSDGRGGTVTAELRFSGRDPVEDAQLTVAGISGPLHVVHGDGVSTASGSITLEEVERWWPHTHGSPVRYPVEVRIGEHQIDLGQVGFREVTVDQSGGAFRVQVNGTDVFCRGACWTPLDPVSLLEQPDQLRAALEQARDANLNMIRIGGETVYPGQLLLDLLDELGILLWQDCMFAFYDLPEDPDLTANIHAELTEQFARLQPHPCLAVLSGGSEIEQQAALMGISAEQRALSQLATTVPALAAELLDGVTYIPSSPTGGALPIQPRSGVAHYYGVGAYLRGVDDARRAGVRFAAECLAFATPPDPQTVDEACGGPARAGHHPEWKRAVYRDAGASWDFEDVRDHYTRRLFGLEPAEVRWTDPERALDLGRATVAHLFEATWSEWRRCTSSCSGALVFHYRDLAPGAGLGVVDALGRPKAPWYVMRRVLAPVAVLLTDEGLNGLDAHVFNDRPETLDALLRVELFAASGLRTEAVERTVSLPGHSSTTVDLTELFDGFRDLSYAHLFGPPAHDSLTATLLHPSGDVISNATFLPGGPARERSADLGLTGLLSQRPDGQWAAELRTERFAQWVTLDVPGFIAQDSWFHLAPGASRTVLLVGGAASRPPRGSVRALNSTSAARLQTVPAPEVS